MDDDIAAVERAIQKDLFAVGARLADPSSRIADRVTKAAVTDGQIERLERRSIDSRRSCRRCVGSSCQADRRAARCCIWRVPSAAAPNAASSGSAPTPSSRFIIYLNRLSDLLFVMARSGQPPRGRAGVRSGDREDVNSIVVHYQEIAPQRKEPSMVPARLVRNLRSAVADLDVQPVRPLMGRIEVVLGPSTRARKSAIVSGGRSASPIFPMPARTRWTSTWLPTRLLLERPRRPHVREPSACRCGAPTSGFR